MYSQQQSRELHGELQALREQQVRLESEWELLRLEQSTLMAEISLDRRAREELQMVVPGPEKTFYVK